RLRGRDVEVVGREAPAVGVLQRVVRLDAGERLVRARVRGAEVVDVARCDGRQRALGGELGGLRQDPLLNRQVRVLQLDVDVAGGEGVGEPRELRLGVGGAVLLERAADAAREAAGEGGRPRAVAGRQVRGGDA